MLKIEKILVVSTSLTIFFFLTACASGVKNRASVESPSLANNPGIQAPSYPEQEYKIQVGDQLDIKFFYNRDLNEQVVVRPDGRISLQLVGEIMTANLTPIELTQMLIEKYATELKNPEITVIVRSFNAHKVYVDGEVSKPGLLNLTGSMTVLQSISQAGGFKESAQVRDVTIIRRGADNRPEVISVDIKKILNGEDLSQDLILMPYDIVYVPKSPIANINRWVDQYIRKNIPTSFGLSYSLNPGNN
jgi:protein involved in polysaccharide export with SLBB domain